MQLSCVIITLQIFWAKPGNPREGGRVERSNEWGGRSREGEARAKPGNQLVSNIIMLLNINATRGPMDCCSATHGLLLSEATGLWDAGSNIFNRGRSVASWTFTGRVFHHAQRPVERAPG